MAAVTRHHLLVLQRTVGLVSDSLWTFEPLLAPFEFGISERCVFEVRHKYVQ
jgi:hypothetical protein